MNSHRTCISLNTDYVWNKGFWLYLEMENAGLCVQHSVAFSTNPLHSSKCCLYSNIATDSRGQLYYIHVCLSLVTLQEQLRVVLINKSCAMPPDWVKKHITPQLGASDEAEPICRGASGEMLPSSCLRGPRIRRSATLICILRVVEKVTSTGLVTCSTCGGSQLYDCC